MMNKPKVPMGMKLMSYTSPRMLLLPDHGGSQHGEAEADLFWR
jgi:hypothetical protein